MLLRFFDTDGIHEIADFAALASRFGHPGGYAFIACSREELAARQSELQAAVHQCGSAPLVDLHISDLLNAQIPSHYDYTSRYDMMIFRRLAGEGESGSAPGARHKGGPTILKRIDTQPLGFVVFERLLLCVHPDSCSLCARYAARQQAGEDSESRPGTRLPASPADLMLRLIGQMVDGFLALRRELTRQLDRWQAALLDPKSRFSNWASLLHARLTLHYLDEICEDQRAALEDWIEVIENWPSAQGTQQHDAHDLLKVRSRDVLEHIERVAHHVRRLEQSTETAIQIHFNAQGNRTNDIMRTLTALTAVFLPLNLLAAIFGMNFEFLPLIHEDRGFWWTIGAMSAITVLLGLIFWRKHYLARSGR